MAYSTEGIHGRMVFMEPTAQSHQGETSHTYSKQRTKLVAISTSHRSVSTRPLELLAPSESGAVRGYLYLFLHLPEIFIYLRVTGSSGITM